MIAFINSKQVRDVQCNSRQMNYFGIHLRFLVCFLVMHLSIARPGACGAGVVSRGQTAFSLHGAYRLEIISACSKKGLVPGG